MTLTGWMPFSDAAQMLSAATGLELAPRDVFKWYWGSGGRLCAQTQFNASSMAFLVPERLWDELYQTGKASIPARSEDSISAQAAGLWPPWQAVIVEISDLLVDERYIKNLNVRLRKQYPNAASQRLMAMDSHYTELDADSAEQAEYLLAFAALDEINQALPSLEKREQNIRLALETSPTVDFYTAREELERVQGEIGRLRARRCEMLVTPEVREAIQSGQDSEIKRPTAGTPESDGGEDCNSKDPKLPPWVPTADIKTAFRDIWPGKIDGAFSKPNPWLLEHRKMPGKSGKGRNALWDPIGIAAALKDGDPAGKRANVPERKISAAFLDPALKRWRTHWTKYLEQDRLLNAGD